MIPSVAHFVFGLKEQRRPFHFLHYLALESCRRVIAPQAILLHHQHLPWGPWWERIRPHLTLVEAKPVPEVDHADYSSGNVPEAYRYAHHADFIRLDALLERGGIYADIDTIFVRPFPADLFDAPFVLGREPDVRDEKTGLRRPSVCNALLMSEPDAAFARAWRSALPAALNGTWSNHSGFLPEELAREMPSAVRVEPECTFFPFASSRAGIAALLEERHPVPLGAVSVHLWAHLWWDQGRRDFSQTCGEALVPEVLSEGRSTLADLARPYLPSIGERIRRTTASRAFDRWRYLSLGDRSGYAHAAHRCMAALERSGIEVDWIPFVYGNGWGLGHEPARALGATVDVTEAKGDERPGRLEAGSVVVAHLVAEYLPRIRRACGDSFLVAHTVWDTDRLPTHWPACLNEADLIVVPSRFSAEAIATSVALPPVAIVPHVAPDLAPGWTESWAWIPEDVVVFYVIGDWHPRKGVDRTIEAFLRAFTSRDKVLLIVKTTQEDPRLRWSRDRGRAHPGTSTFALARLLARYPDAAPVHLVTRRLSDAEIAGLHARGDCFASLCRSEGWGLGAFDAAAYGNPAVITGFGGQLDFLGDSPYLVAHRLAAVDDLVHLQGAPPDQHWAEPDIDHGAALLREVAVNLDQARAGARERGEQLRHQYRPAAIAAALRSAVEAQRSGGERRGSPVGGAGPGAQTSNGKH